MTYGSDEYLEARRADLLRDERRRRVAALFDAIVNAVLAVLAIGALLGICYLAKGREVRERAAYNQGRWGVDRATAVAMAERGVGKTAREVLSTNYTNYHELGGAVMKVEVSAREVLSTDCADFHGLEGR